jgi:hypothetical protein
MHAVLQIFGRMNKTIEGVPVEEGASYVNKYFLLPTNIKPTDTVTLSLDEGELEEGYYHMSAKVKRQSVGACWSLHALCCIAEAAASARDRLSC